MTVPEGATCPRHAGEASGVCSRCGRFICPACTLRVGLPPDLHTVCEECAPRVPVRLGYPGLSIVSVIVGGVSLGCWPLGPVAIILGVVHLVRASKADGQRSGTTLDVLGIALGAVSVLIGLVMMRGRGLSLAH